MDIKEPERKYRAQDRYAQEVLTYLWDHAADICEASEDGVFYRGSIHMLVRKSQPRAQAGDVVSILKSVGAIQQVQHGLWLLVRKEVFFDDNGRPVEMDQPTFGHDTKGDMQLKTMQDLGKRVSKLEDGYAALTAIIVGWGGGPNAGVDGSTSNKPPENESSGFIESFDDQAEEPTI